MMLNKDNQGIQKYILDRLVTIQDEILIHDSEFQELGGETQRDFLAALRQTGAGG